MCNGHQILSPVDKATVPPIIGNSLRVGSVLYCVCRCPGSCGNCLLSPNPCFSRPQFSTSEVKFSLIEKIVINPKSLSSPLFCGCGQQCQRAVRCGRVRRQNYWICLERRLKQALMPSYAAYCTQTHFALKPVFVVQTKIALQSSLVKSSKPYNAEHCAMWNNELQRCAVCGVHSEEA